MSVWLYSKFSTSRLRVREDEVYMQLLNQNILYISRLRVQKDSIITCFNRLWVRDVRQLFTSMRDASLLRYANDLRVREVNLVSEYTHSFNEKCFSSAVRLWIDSFAPSPVPPVVQNERIQVQIECVRCKNHSVVDGASKHAWLPSQTAFTTLASPRPYHPILGKRRDLRE